MLPWKVFIRSVSAVTLLAMGGLAAGQDVLPFSHVSRSVGTQAVIDDQTAPADEVDETPAVDEAALPADDTTTTTEPPETAAPDVAGDTEAPAPSDVPVIEVTEIPEAPTTVPPAAPEVDAPDTPPAAPVEDDAAVICAAAAEKACGPVEPVPAADSSIDARVERCVAWWNRLADRLDGRGRPRWAARARMVADRCDEMIARWQERQDRRDARQGRVENRREKGDHNNDGHPDNGWHNKDRDRRNGRPETVPGQVNKAERHGEGRR
jgi:hypothetical protein